MKAAMNNAARFAIAVATAALLASCAASAVAAEATVAPADAPPLTQAQAPAFAVGEEWEFAYANVLDPQQNHHYTQRVASVAPDQTTLTVGDGRGGPTLLDANANLVRAGGESYAPSDEKLQFPLAVGKSWSSSYVYKNGGWLTHCDRSAKVVAVERVSTPAGDFDAFRIEQRTGWSSDEHYGGQGVTHETVWYAPAVGRIVKLEFESIPIKGPAHTTRMELARFKPASAPATLGSAADKPSAASAAAQ